MYVYVFETMNLTHCHISYEQHSFTHTHVFVHMCVIPIMLLLACEFVSRCECVVCY